MSCHVVLCDEICFVMSCDVFSALLTLLSSPSVGPPLSNSSSDLFSPLTSHLPLIPSRPILSHPNTLSGADVVTQVATKRINWSSYHIDSKKDNIGAPLIMFLILILFLLLFPSCISPLTTLNSLTVPSNISLPTSSNSKSPIP